jgi:hypothetical protein
MINNFKAYSLFLMLSVFFIYCGTSKKNINNKGYDITGLYVNKIKANHFKENLELLKDHRFRLTTRYEWSKYEYSGVWQLKSDTLLLKLDSSVSLANEKYFKSMWLVKENLTELLLLNNQSYSLEKSN